MSENPMAVKVREYVNARLLKAAEATSTESASKQPSRPNDVSSWIDDAAQRSAQIFFTTHPTKFSHPDAGGSSIYVKAKTDPSAAYVSTNNTNGIEPDVGGNAAALGVAGLLLLEEGGTTLAEQLENNDVSALRSFARTEEQLAEWHSMLLRPLQDPLPRSHQLNKQVYFPLDDGSYHLLSPNSASSLASEMKRRIDASRFSEEASVVRKARKEETYHSSQYVYFPRIGVQKFGGTKPQNISLLASRNRGQFYLLCSAPPEWKDRDIPKLHSKDSFWKYYSSEAGSISYRLGAHLRRQPKNRTNIEIRGFREKRVDELVEKLMECAAWIQQQPSGWSQSTELTRAEQLWLDPLLDDPTFQEERLSSDWKAEISEQFARWLNSTLKRMKIETGDDEFREWRSILKTTMALVSEYF